MLFYAELNVLCITGCIEVPGSADRKAVCCAMIGVVGTAHAQGKLRPKFLENPTPLRMWTRRLKSINRHHISNIHVLSSAHTHLNTTLFSSFVRLHATQGSAALYSHLVQHKLLQSDTATQALLTPETYQPPTPHHSNFALLSRRPPSTP